MSDFKLKLILSVLAGIMFAFIFILLSFALPVKNDNGTKYIKKPKNRIESISQSLKK